MSNNWTPGPWQVRVKDGGETITAVERERNVRHERVAICQFPWTIRRNGRLLQSEANARLIAAAPELYEALHRIQQTIDAYNADDSGTTTFAEFFFDNGLDGLVNTVLAKARGEQ
jgi:hypothetical protein